MRYEKLELQNFLSSYNLISPTQEVLEIFSKNIKDYLLNIKNSKNSKESQEEFEKNILRDFLSKNFNYQTNTKGKIDLAIYEDSTPKVLCEIKSQNNINEFINSGGLYLDSKAFYESILYYLRESITNKNNNLTFIILSNALDFYLIEAKEYIQFGNNKEIFQAFKNCENKEGNDTSTKRFYDEVKKILPKLDSTLHYTHFKLDEKLLDSTESATLSFIYQALSPFVLLKRKSYIDANTLNQGFYNELLHILGLEENTQNGKVIIEPSSTQNTLLYSICKAFNLDKDKDFEDIFSLLMIWNNRILFLRLLESMLKSFGHITKPFLDLDSIADFATLNTLFFDVLAKKEDERDKSIKNSLTNIPYLNSSLFDKTELEIASKEIKLLESKPLKLYKDSILYRDKSFYSSLNLKTKDSSLPLLEYLFSFLHAYDFTTTPQDIEKHTKTNFDKLINASVLGLVFEKLNGYKEGSFYTPSFITNYMCKESITKIVIDKFNIAYKWNARNFKDIINSAREDNLTAKDLLNILLSIRICDPSVGSGHFLVSALNEMVYIAYKIGLLESLNFNTTLELNNDEIVIKQNGRVFNYKKPDSTDEPNHKIQIELFNLKRKLIESCLFGVDINPNSCEITKLRLWIELLKYSYYKDIENKRLETLPNIDINIKCGNSLVSNFELNECDEQGNPKRNTIKWLQNQDVNFSNNFKAQIENYKKYVSLYKEALTDKSQLIKSIENIKMIFKNTLIECGFTTENLHNNLQKFVQIYGDECFDMETPFGMEMIKIIRDKNKKGGLFRFQPTLSQLEPNPLDKKGQDLLNKIYENFIEIENLRNQETFEWRFAFPEILDSNGDFLGFDLVIGNPPYIRQEAIKALKPQLEKAFAIFKGTSDIYTYFYEQGYKILKQGGILSFITSNKWTRAGYGEPLRQFLLENTTIHYYLDLNGVKVFDSATVDTSILEFTKSKAKANHTLNFANPKSYNPKDNKPLSPKFIAIPQNSLKPQAFIFGNQDSLKLKAKIEALGTPLKEWDISIYRGILTGYNEAFIIDSAKREEILAKCKDEEERIRTNELIKPILRGKDIKRYSYEWAGLWIINTHNGYSIDNSSFGDFCGSLDLPHCEAHSSASHSSNPAQPTKSTQNTRIVSDSSAKDKIKIPPIDIEEYPTLKAYFDEIGKNHKGKGKGLFDRDDKGITPYNLRNCAYLPEFAKEKIVYSEIVREPQFYLDNGKFKFGHFYAEATSFILSGNENFHNTLEYLLGILHSKLATFAFKEFYAGGGLGENGYRYKKAFLEKLPIPKISKKQEKAFVELVQQIINHKKQGKNSKELENELDTKVYALYNLSNEEIEIIIGGGREYRALILALLLLASVESQCLDVVKILCENFESEFVEAFRFCEGLKLPCVEKGAKIIYPNMAKEFIAYLDTKGFFTNQKCFILTDKVKDKDRLLYLTAILNSKTNFWYFKHIGATLGASGYEMSKIFVERLPIVETHKIDSTLLGEIESLVREILDLYAESRPLRGAEIVDKGGSSASARLELEAETSEALPLIAEKAASFSRVKGSGEGLNPFLREKDKRNNNKIYNLQSRLDSLIYQIYDLSNDEINLIESEFADKEREREREQK